MTYADVWRKYLREQGPKVLLLAIALFAGIGLQLVAPRLVRDFIDAAREGVTLAALYRTAGLFLAAALGTQLLAVLSTYLSADVGWRATNALRADLFRHTLRLDMRFHKDRTPGELIERIDGDATHLANFLSQFVVVVTGSLLLVVGILALLWLEDWRAGLLLTAYVAAVTTVLHKRREVAVPATEIEREANATLFGFIEERLAGIDDIRANGAGRYVMHRMLQVQRDWYEKGMRAWSLRASIWWSMIGMTMAGEVMILALGIALYFREAITLGTVYLFYNYMTLLDRPLEELSRQLQEFQRAGAGLRRVRQLFAEEPAIKDGGGAGLPQRAHAVCFENVWFSYEGQPVLRGVDFRLEPGETLGLIGRTGSGKTTIIRLLSRLYDPVEGRILLDGKDLRDLPLAELRARVGLVTQDVELFEGTIRENLTFFDPSVSDERLVEIFDALGLGEWLEALPDGLDTHLEAGGSGFSAGESQLLAFARLFLLDPGVVILDEPTSRLDPATEKRLTRAVARLFEGRTGIVIAHRLETVRRLDKIMVLSDGAVIEFGDQEALAQDPSSVYRAMLRLGDEAGSADLDALPGFDALAGRNASIKPGAQAGLDPGLGRQAP